MGVLKSAYIGGHELTYYHDKWTIRPLLEDSLTKACGPMAVFDTLENLKEFLKCDWVSYSIKIHRAYKCEYSPSKENRLWHRQFGMIYDRTNLPQGTVLADSVRLLEKVSLDDMIRHSNEVY